MGCALHSDVGVLARIGIHCRRDRYGMIAFIPFVLPLMVISLAVCSPFISGVSILSGMIVFGWAIPGSMWFRIAQKQGRESAAWR